MENEPKKIKILVADDEPTMRNALRRHLVENNFIVVEANNGKEALEKTANEQFDLIILDGNMPEMNGIDACKRLKSSPRTQNIPILFSTGTHINDVREGKVPADDYIEKPYTFNMLMVKIKELLRL